MTMNIDPAPPRRLLAAILGGGQSQRFGSDKALALFRGHAIIDHVLAAATSMAEAVVLCGRTHHDLTALPDRPAPDLGPLGGLCAALHHGLKMGYSHVLTLGCDMPILPVDLVAQLSGPGSAFVSDQPIVGLWETGLAPLLDAHLARDGNRAMRRWIEQCGARGVTLRWALPNINTPEDLALLEAQTGDSATG